MNIEQALETLSGLTAEQAADKVCKMGEPAILLEAYDKMELEGKFKPDPAKIVYPVWTPTPQPKKSIDIDTAIHEIEKTDETKGYPEIRPAPEEGRPIKPDAIIQQLNEITQTHPEIIQTLIEEIDKGYHKMTLKQFIDVNISYVSDLINDGTSKKERAAIVYNLKKDYPHISISPMLYFFEVGESTFRTERLIHKSEWDIKYKEQQVTNARWVIHHVLKGNFEDLEGMFSGIDVKRVCEIVNKAGGGK